ncbi:MAG: hypothetical protein DRO05_03850 [Thermoproteota archaeon]|nr:MAG: hypothetical protein DRO05_03850 [Candidatus Korarchaeota archaeon]
MRKERYAQKLNELEDRGVPKGEPSRQRALSSVSLLLNEHCYIHGMGWGVGGGIEDSGDGLTGVKPMKH